MPSTPQSQAAILFAKAQKKATSSTGWFSSFAGGSSKWEEAGDLYQQTGNAFRIEKKHVEAGDAYAKEAECREEQKEYNDAANAWWNAARSYKTAGNEDLAVNALEQTIRHLTSPTQGRFRQAADRMKEIAAIRKEQGRLAEACQSLERAAELYQQENAAATANGCLKEAADLHAELDEWVQAINNYEIVSNHALGSALTKYSAKEYWLLSGLCALANGDDVTAARQLNSHLAEDPSFSTTREAKFLSALVQAAKDVDNQAFATACLEYDKVSKLDKLKTHILLKIKNTFDEDVSLT